LNRKAKFVKKAHRSASNMPIWTVMKGRNGWWDGQLATVPQSLFVLSGPAPSPFKRYRPVWTFCP
jgi:hypothetical protein